MVVQHVYDEVDNEICQNYRNFHKREEVENLREKGRSWNKIVLNWGFRLLKGG